MARSPKEWLRVLRDLLFLIIVSPIIILFLLLMPFTYYWEYRRANALRREFEARWGRQGKQGILVYSNSPHWKAYIDERWLPFIGALLVVMNWSERTGWSASHPFEARIFRIFSGDRDFNPIAIVFPQPPASLRQTLSEAWRQRDLLGFLFPRTDVKVIRFWKAFRDFKHGRERALRAAETELFLTLRVPPPVNSHAAA